MRQRLMALIGPEALKVSLNTFHGFSNRIIQENPEYFSQRPVEILTELEKIGIIRRLLDDLEIDHALIKGKKWPYHYEKQLSHLFQIMKKEGWTPGQIHRATAEYARQLPSLPAFVYQRNTKNNKKGELKTALLANVTERMEQLKAGADLYPRYQHALETAGRYEYDDMLNWVNQAFSRHEHLLRSYQERFLYFMVDEYQDTNGSQNALLHTLLDYWQNPNVFIVGDDDQSIFEFQGARLRNLLDFSRKFSDSLETIVLTANYRSTQPILNAAESLIEHNLLRAVNLLPGERMKKQLRSQSDRQGTVRAEVYDTALQELVGVATTIRQLLESGAEPNDIAVIYARHKQAEPLMRLLDDMGIPFQTYKPVNLLFVPLVRQIIGLLQYLHEESEVPFSGEHRLFSILHAPYWQIPPAHLATAMWHLQHQRQQDETLFFRTSEPTGDKEGKIKTALEHLNLWIGAGLHTPPLEFIETIYRGSGMLQWCLDQPDAWQHIRVIHSFSDFVRSACERNPKMDLSEILTLIDQMEDNDLPLPMTQSIRPGSGVHLLTAHAAKGLEFEHVFVFDCNKTVWQGNSARGGRQFYFPEILHVAITRAKTGLYGSFSKSNAGGKSMEACDFLLESRLPVNPATPDEAEVEAAMRRMLLRPHAPVIEMPPEAMIREALTDFSLNISALNRFLSCKLAFYYVDIVRVPFRVNEEALYGQAVHETLRAYFQAMKSHPNQEYPGGQAMQSLFEQQMLNKRAFFRKPTFLQRLEFGKSNLNRFALEQVAYWKKRAVTERRLERVSLGTASASGIIDRIEWTDGGLQLIDFKTGKRTSTAISPPSENLPYGGDYWRQLAFYQLLIAYSGVYSEQVVQGVVSWVEPDSSGHFFQDRVSFTASELQLVVELCETVYRQIMKGDFLTGCESANCSWCALHRRQATAAYTDVGDLDDSTTL
jgi:DNA helicase-2/ATP-dependent DNA helicase PcrA